MADTGTGTDPGTDRCPDCGHLRERECGCSCCGLIGSMEAQFAMAQLALEAYRRHFGSPDDV